MRVFNGLLQRFSRGARSKLVQFEPNLSNDFEYNPGQGTGKDRADFRVETQGTAGSRVVVCDLIVSHPNVMRGGLYKKADTVGGSAAEAAYKFKEDSYEKRWRIPKGQFLPLAMETGGRWHPDCRKFVQKYLRDFVSRKEPENWKPEEKALYARSMQTVLEAVGVALCRSVASSLAHLARCCKGYAQADTGEEQQDVGADVDGNQPDDDSFDAAEWEDSDTW